ncbi:MAG: hypothetical protein M0C28_02545 [Candidatus Moduliflexus flocculans]|nr:hypothetical protein [Candidatus Moduliflexus flocculans]
MDNVVTHVLGIHRRKVRKVEGDTGKYYEQIAAEEEIYEKTRINDERKMKEMDLFITRFRAKARLGGLVQSRVKSLEKMEKRAQARGHQDARVRLRREALLPQVRPRRPRPLVRLHPRPAAHPPVLDQHRGQGPGLRHRPQRPGQDDPAPAPRRATSRPGRARSTRRSRSRPATSSRPTSRPCPSPTPSSRRSSRPTPRAIPSGPASSPAA